MDQSKRLLLRLGKLDEPDPSPEIIFSSTNLSRFYFPGRGIAPSFIMHIVACAALFIPTLLRAFILPLPPPDQVVFIDLANPTTVMYLPPLQGNPPQPAAGKNADAADERTPPQAGKEGLSYPGLQTILSNPPEPTNSIQTILQPELEAPETLIPPLPVPNTVQTENTPLVVQSPKLPELELAGRERLPGVRMKRPAAEIPDPLYAPPEDFPELEIPDLMRATGTEPELTLPETQMARLEPMPTPVQKTAINDPVDATSTSFPKSNIPELLRTGESPEPKMALSEVKTAPIERMRVPVQKPAANEFNDIADAPQNSFAKTNIPELLRTGAEPEPEMVLSETKTAPIERIREYGKKPPVNPPGAGPAAPSANFPKTQIPSLVRAPGTGSEMVLPESKRAPVERIRRPGPKPESGIPDAGYAPPPATVPPKVMPKMVKVSPPTRGDRGGSGGNEPQLTSTKPESSPAGARDNVSAAAEGKKILTLTPMPPLPDFQIAIPEGETRGGFSISSDPNLETESIEPGAQSEEAPGQKVFEIMAMETAKEAGTLPAGPGNIENAAGTDDSDNGYPAPDVIVLNGGGEEAFDGITIIDGSEEPRDGTSDFLSTPSGNSDNEIEVIGGILDRGDAASMTPPKRLPPPLQTDYYLTIISNEDSGSVLPPTNFIRNTSYTVYLDMRESIEEVEQYWILEFGLLDDVDINPVLSLDFENYTEGLLLPFPSRKKRPPFLDAVDRKYWGSMILLSGIVNPKGRLEQLSIVDNPNPDFNVGLLERLDTWVFRPARLNRQPVAVKVVIGIPF